MNHVDLTPLYGLLNEGLLTLLGGLAIWLSAAAKIWLQEHAKFLGEQTDAQLAAGLNRALSNGVAIAMQQAESLEKQAPGIPIKSTIAAYAAEYAINHSPAAIDKFGLSPTELATKALAYLPTPAVSDDTTGKTIPAPQQVQVKNLDPPK